MSHMLLPCDCGGVRYEDEPCKFCRRLAEVRAERDEARARVACSGCGQDIRPREVADGRCAECLWAEVQQLQVELTAAQTDLIRRNLGAGEARKTNDLWTRAERAEAEVARLREMLGRQEDEQP